VGGVRISAIRFADDPSMVSYCKRITSYYGCTAGYIIEVQDENKDEENQNHENVYGRRKKYENHSQWTESGKSETILLPRTMVTEDCRSCHIVRRRIALGKEAFNKKRDLMRRSLSLYT